MGKEELIKCWNLCCHPCRFSGHLKVKIAFFATLCMDFISNFHRMPSFGEEQFVQVLAATHVNLKATLKSKNAFFATLLEKYAISFLGGLRVTNPPIRLMCLTSVDIFCFRTLTRKRFVQSNSNLPGR